MNSLQCLDQKCLLGLTISCSKAALDIFAFLLQPLVDTLLSHGAKQMSHSLQVAPAHLSPPASEQKQPSQTSVRHQVQ